MVGTGIKPLFGSSYCLLVIAIVDDLTIEMSYNDVAIGFY